MRQVTFERWWGRVVGIFALSFMLWFIIREVEGLASLLSFLVDGIAAVPESLRIIADYYASISGRLMLGSVLVGGSFGFVTTAIVYLVIDGWLEFPVFSAVSAVSGLITGVFAYSVVGGGLALSFLLALIVMIVVAYWTEHEVRTFFSANTLRRFWDPRIVTLFIRSLFVGGLTGAVGAQFLTYPMQHCTYALEASPAERQLGMVATAIGSLLLLVPVWTLVSRRVKTVAFSKAGYFHGMILPYLFLIPTLIALGVFLYYPALQVAVLSFSAQRFRQTRFVCLSNYLDLFHSTIYQNSLITTLMMTIAIVFFSMVAGLLVAMLASQKVRGANIYRTLLVWPYALSPVVTGTIFLAMFRQGQSGLINYGLDEIFGVTFNWFTDASLAPWVVIFASVWNALGFNILFYIAGLQNVPKDLLEAAHIDGANRIQRFVFVTFPLLSPYTFFLLVTNVTYSFYGIYGAVDTLTQGGPPLGVAGQDGGATNVLIYKLYEDAFAPGAQIGGSAAQSIVLFVLVAIFTLFQFRYVERRVTYAD